MSYNLEWREHNKVVCVPVETYSGSVVQPSNTNKYSLRPQKNTIIETVTVKLAQI